MADWNDTSRNAQRMGSVPRAGGDVAGRAGYDEGLAVEHAGFMALLDTPQSKAFAAAFKANPSAYAPQYGGHCAWAIAQDYLAPGDPTAYDIVGGKLYLNYDQDIRAKWRKNTAGFIAKGGPNWAKTPSLFQIEDSHLGARADQLILEN